MNTDHASKPTAMHGAAGSFGVVLRRVYDSCRVLFYGAEVIQDRPRIQGREIAPSAAAKRVDDTPDDHPSARPELPDKQQVWG